MMKFDNNTAVTIRGTKGDQEHRRIITNILYRYGNMDKNPRPKYADGTPAHTLSYNGDMSRYDLSKGDFPIITLRPIATKSAIGEILWIYQDQSNDLDILKNKYGITWWDPWKLENENTIGQVYGATVKRWDLMNRLLEGIKKDPDGRRHIMSLWQEQDLSEPHGLKPCAFLTMWNVVHAKDKDYLDMALVIRSSDFMTAGCINQVQYVALQYMVARHLGYEPGVFTFFMNNIQIYDRHIDGAKELINRTPVVCSPKLWLNPDKKDFYDFTIDDIKVIDYPVDEIKKQNPQIDAFKENIGI